MDLRNIGAAGGELGEEYVTCEISSNKAPKLAEWLNLMDANGYELAGMQATAGYLIAVARRKKE